MCASHGILVKRPWCDLVCVHPSQSRPHSHMSVPPKWEHILRAQLLPAREVLVLPWREPTHLSMQILVQGLVLFLNHEPLFFLWSNLINPNPTGSVTLIQPTAISCIINTFSLFFSGIQARHAGPPPTLSRRPVVSFMQSFFKKPVITFRTSSEQFLVCTGNTDLAILLNKDTFEPCPMVLAFKEDSTSKSTWCMVLLIVRGLLRRPSLSGSPTVTFCSVHIHNVVAKKRDASTELLLRLYGYMREHNVDFIGGDFNMSAFIHSW